MSTPDQTTNPSPAADEPLNLTWEDLIALAASDDWFHLHGPHEQYKGMHVAILGERIIDADSNWEALAQRLDAKPELFPLLFRYVPTDEEAMRFRY
jgi:hypothetical protein